MEDTVAGQFETITAAARGCDVLVAGMALQFALHSVAEQLGIPYVYAAWCPITLPSPHHAPPPLPVVGTASNGRHGRQSRTLDSGRETLERPLGRSDQLPSGGRRFGEGLRRAEPHPHRPAMAGRRLDVCAMARDRRPGCCPDGRLDSCGPEATVPRAGGVPRRRRATRLLRLRQHARSTGREPGDDQGGARGRPP